MEILQVIDSLSIGGSESLSASLAEQFSTRGIKCQICAMGANGPLQERLDQAGIKATHLNIPQGIDLGAALSLGQLVLKSHIDVILTHHFRQLIHAVPAATFLRRRLVHVEHDYHSYEQRPDILRKLNLVAPFVYKFVFVSDQIRDWFVKRLPKVSAKCISIPNGIDTILFCRHQDARISLRNRLNAQAQTVIIGTCARLEPIKDIALLVHGFSLMVKASTHTDLDPRLVIVGDGSQREYLELLVNSLGLADKCHFVGVVSDVYNWLSAFDVYAITSVDEGLPLSVLEAMSASLPIVAVNVGSLTSIVDNSVGTILMHRTPENLGEKLFSLCTDLLGAKERGARARATIVKRYSIHAMTEAYLTTIQ